MRPSDRNRRGGIGAEQGRDGVGDGPAAAEHIDAGVANLVHQHPTRGKESHDPMSNEQASD